MENENKIETAAKVQEISIIKNDREYKFIMPDPTSLGDAFDVTYSLLSRILEAAKEATEKARPQVKE